MEEKHFDDQYESTDGPWAQSILDAARKLVEAGAAAAAAAERLNALQIVTAFDDK